MNAKHSAYFMQLVLIFHTAAMQHMGKLKNPLTDRIERDLAQAQAAIDMLDMLRELTKGNLAAGEEKFIGTMLQELKLNYVDEINKPEPPAAMPPKAEPHGAAADGTQSKPPEGAPPEDSHKEETK